jgi:hypothetical protein
MKLLRQFENIITLKTIMDYKDYEDITYDDLEEIIMLADELDVDLNCIDLYNSNLINLFAEWFEDVNFIYNDIKEQLIEIMSNKK